MDVALSDHLRKRRDEDDDGIMLFLGVASRSCEELSGSIQDGA
jgi:hypothetical protein